MVSTDENTLFGFGVWGGGIWLIGGGHLSHRPLFNYSKVPTDYASTNLCHVPISNTLAPVQNMHNFIDIIMSTNYGLFHSFGKSPACPRVNLGLGRFFVDKRFFVDFGQFFQIFHKISALPRASTK